MTQATQFPNEDMILAMAAAMHKQADEAHKDGTEHNGAVCEMCALADGFASSKAVKTIIQEEAVAGMTGIQFMAFFFFLGLKCGAQQAYDAMSVNGTGNKAA